MGPIESDIICIRASGVCGGIWVSASTRMIAHVVTCIIDPWILIVCYHPRSGVLGFLSFLVATVLLNSVCIFRK